ncbi:MAG: hypothetical protein ACPLRN_00930 [Microgenomates group bacterium]
MKKKIFTVNLIIIFFLFFVIAFQTKAQTPTTNKSVQIDQEILTPIIVTQAPPKITEIIENISQINNDFQNDQNNQSSNKNHNSKKNSSAKIKNGLVYYTQYGNNYKLPNQDGGSTTCTIHYAGCGPTTSAMIIASYVDKSITPEKVVDYFGKKGYYLGCSGSSTYDNKTIVEAFGVKTSPDVMSFNLDDAKEIAPLLKNYLKAGWTFFALANFRANGGGHFFWIVDIDANDNILAYDPWYGRYEQPFNENNYYPFPKYRQLFKVRRQ